MATTKSAKGKTTAVSFNSEELTALARLIGAGRVMLQMDAPVIAKLKAAMTRMGVSTKGL